MFAQTDPLRLTRLQLLPIQVSLPENRGSSCPLGVAPTTNYSPSRHGKPGEGERRGRRAEAALQQLTFVAGGSQTNTTNTNTQIHKYGTATREEERGTIDFRCRRKIIQSSQTFRQTITTKSLSFNFTHPTRERGCPLQLTFERLRRKNLPRKDTATRNICKLLSSASLVCQREKGYPQHLTTWKGKRIPRKDTATRNICKPGLPGALYPCCNQTSENRKRINFSQMTTREYT